MIRRSPRIYAYMDHSEIDFAEGCHHFSELLRQLAAVSPYVRTDTLLTSEEQMDSGIGLDPLNNMDHVIETLIAHRDAEDQRISKRVWSERWKDSRAVVKVKYRFAGSEDQNPNYIECESRRNASDTDNFSLTHWLRIVETIINWRRPLYLWGGDAKFWYGKHGVFSPDRTVANWFCWVPQQVEPSQIPSAAIVRPMLGGTLIVSLERYFNIDHLEAVRRVNDVEVEMNAAGILPHHTDLSTV